MFLFTRTIRQYFRSMLARILKNVLYRVVARLGQNENVGLNGYNSESYSSSQRFDSKIPLKLVMDPRGVVQDLHSTGLTFDQNNGMLSPDKCAELISALHTDAPKGKGLSHNCARGTNKMI